MTRRERLLQKGLNSLPSLRGLVVTVQPASRSLPRGGQNHSHRVLTDSQEVLCTAQILPKLAQDLIGILKKKKKITASH